MRYSTLAVLLLGVFGAVFAGADVTAPRVAIHSMKELPTPLPYPYDEKADDKARVDAAFARARADGKRVLIDFGGNWCPDCRILAAVMELPSVKPFILAHFEVVTVDIGRYSRNLDIVHRFGIQELRGAPTIVIADPDGTPVNITDSAELADARSMTPQGIADWLARYAVAGAE
ncbi:MAG: thioredoxin family protein [Pseudomonadales bacterium]|nr:thioredoxin family protein [Pseudomonadales bacterium]